MKTVMWIQSDSVGGSDIYYVDGKQVDDNTLKRDANNILMKAQSVRYQNSRLIKRLRQETGSPNFTLAYSPFMGYLYKSIFNERATDGRLKSFVLWCNATNNDTLWEIAKNISSKTHFTLRDNEQFVVRSFTETEKKKQLIAIIGIALLLLIFIIYAIL